MLADLLTVFVFIGAVSGLLFAADLLYSVAERIVTQTRKEAHRGTWH